MNVRDRLKIKTITLYIYCIYSLHISISALSSLVCVNAFQGEWKPKQIDNPAYKGVWVHPEIDNPEYTADAALYKYEDIGVIGFDLWQVRTQLYVSAIQSPICYSILLV